MIRSLIVLSILLSPLPLAAKTSAILPTTRISAPERFIPLEGGRNFRDLGGYRTQDGHVVKRGAIYRSGSLGKLTPADLARLNGLGIAAIIDLRSGDERGRDTADLRGTFGQGYWTRDYANTLGDGRLGMPDPAAMTAADGRAFMRQVYRALPAQQAPAYRAMFARLLASPGPLVVNCTAGKDRTGIAASLILTALGVPYETVRQDFLLSNGAPGMATLLADMPPSLRGLSPEVLAPVMGVEGGYLDIAFAQIRQDYGSVDAFLEKELGVGPRETAQLKARLLTS